MSPRRMCAMTNKGSRLIADVKKVSPLSRLLLATSDCRCVKSRRASHESVVTSSGRLLLRLIAAAGSPVNWRSHRQASCNALNTPRGLSARNELLQDGDGNADPAPTPCPNNRNQSLDPPRLHVLR